MNIAPTNSIIFIGLFCLMLRIFTTILILFLLTGTITAQSYLPIDISGFNSDLFAETAPNSLATTSMSTDLTSHVMYTETFATGTGLPAGVVNSGTIVSGTKTYQMAPYDAQNAVYIDVTITQTITLNTAASYAKISLMGFSAEGNSTLNIKLVFTDGSITNAGNFTLWDWFNGANAVYCCFSRCIRTTSAPYNIDGLPSNPRFYPIDITLSCADQLKSLQSIIIKNTAGTTGFTNAFLLAVSGIAYSQNIVPQINDVSCAGGTDGSVNLNVSGSTAPYSYSWNTIPTQTTAAAGNLPAGSYVCTITDANGCTTTDTFEVSTLPESLISAQASPVIICSGAAAQLSENGLTNVLWLPGGQTTATATVNPTVTTTYVLYGTDSNGCARTDTVTVAVNPLPLIAVNPDPAVICSGGSIVLQASGAINYTWTPATGLNNSTISNPTANPAATTTYTVTGTDGNNCSNTAEATVTVNPSPSVVVTANPAIICQGASTALAVSGLASYSWNPGGQTVSPINVSPLTTTTYTVSGTGSNGCSGTATITVTVNPLPPVDCMPVAAAVCAGDSIILTAVGGISYIWSPAGNLSNAFIANPTASPLVTTVYTVTGYNAFGCSATATSAITVFPAATVQAMAVPSVICVGDSTTLSVTGLTDFTWAPGGQTTSPIILQPDSSMIYTVSGLDGNGCAGEDAVQVSVFPVPVVIATSSDTLVCGGSEVTLQALGFANQYTWNPGMINGSTATVFPSDSTTYIITGTTGNCSATDSITIDVVPLPVVAFYPSLLTGCDPLTVLFTDQSANATEWKWQFSDGGLSGDQNPSHTFAAGVWSVSETVSNALGCSNTLTLPDLIQVFSHPQADFSVDPAFNLPLELQFAQFHFYNLSTGASSYLWDFDDGAFSTEKDPLHAYTKPGDFAVTLIAISSGNCDDTITQSFAKVIPATTAFIPSAFTPNGDGLNDLFIPANQNLSGLDMKIFNRWGNLVFHGTSVNDGWDGNVKGLPAEIGVYVYSVSLEFENGKKEIRKGNVTLIR